MSIELRNRLQNVVVFLCRHTIAVPSQKLQKQLELISGREQDWNCEELIRFECCPSPSSERKARHQRAELQSPIGGHIHGSDTDVSARSCASLESGCLQGIQIRPQFVPRDTGGSLDLKHAERRDLIPLRHSLLGNAQ